MIKASLRGVEAAFKELSAKIKLSAKDQAKLATTRLTEEVRQETPIDTGMARSRWDMRETAEGAFEIRNDTDYIEYLNAGSSKQAPAHFVEAIALKYGKPVGIIAEIKDN